MLNITASEIFFRTTLRPELGSKLQAGSETLMVSFKLGYLVNYKSCFLLLFIFVIVYIVVKQNPKLKPDAKVSLPAWGLDPRLGLKVVPTNISGCRQY